MSTNEIGNAYGTGPGEGIWPMSDIKRYWSDDPLCVACLGNYVLYEDHLAAVQAERERCKREQAERLFDLVCDIMERREYAECWYADDPPGDCGNWPQCYPNCSLRELMDMAGFVPQEDGGIDRQDKAAAVERAMKEKADE